MEKSANAIEIAQGMTVEQIIAEYFDTTALVEQPEDVFRLQTKGNRYYYKFVDGEPIFYVSVTTMIKQTMPTSPYLIKWIAEQGYEESQNYAAERASYGTFMHAELGYLLVNRTYDFDTLKGRLRTYMESNQLPANFINYADDIKSDILAFAQFMIEHNVKPIAIEIVLTHPTDGYAGAVDLVCEMDYEEKGYFGEVYKSGVQKGSPKLSKRDLRIIVMIDFKSGRKGFYEEHEIQLQAYKEMWNAHFESKPVDKIMNWSPKDWRGKTPTYNLKDQTNSPNLEKLPFLVDLARIQDAKRKTSVVIIDGKVDIDKGEIGNIIEMELSELVKKRKEDAPKPIQDETIADNIIASANVKEELDF